MEGRSQISRNLHDFTFHFLPFYLLALEEWKIN